MDSAQTSANEELKHVWLRRLHVLANASTVLFAVCISFPVTYNWVALIIGLVLWFGVLVLRYACGQPVFSRPPLLWPIVGFTLAVGFSGMLHGGLREALGSLALLRPMVAYFWAYDLFRRNERLQIVCVSALLALSMVAGFWGTVQQLTGYHPFGFKYLQGTGFLSAPMAFAGQMQLFSLLAFALWLTGAYRRLLIGEKSLFLLVLAGNVLGLIFAAERSAWLGFAMGAALVTLLISWRVAVKLGVASVLALVAAWGFIPVFKQRLIPLLDWQHDVSTRARFVVWERAWSEFQRFPLYGVGIRKFPHIYIPEALVPGQANYLGHAHSNYLHILATTGLFGFGMYIWLLFASLSACWRQFWFERCAARGVASQRQYSFACATGLGLLGSLVSLAVAGIFEYNFGTSQVRLAQWFLLALIVIEPQRVKGNSRK